MIHKHCPIHGCEERIPWHFLMCGDHWRQVPRDLRDDVWRAYRGGSGVHNDDYRAARDAAVAAVSP